MDKEYGTKNTSEVDRLIQGYFSVLTCDLFNTLSNLMSGNRHLEPADLKDIRSVCFVRGEVCEETNQTLGVHVQN